MNDEQGTPSTPEEVNAASDAALNGGDVARYNEIENARELSERTGKAQTVAEPPPAKASETADPDPASDKSIQEKPGPKESKRIKELLDGRIELENENVRLKAEIEKAKPGEKKVADPPPAKPKEEAGAPKAGDAPTEPDLNDFATYAEYAAAEKKYVREMVAFEAKKAIQADRVERQAAETQQKNAEGWEAQVTAAKGEHADYAEVAFSKETPITDVMHAFIIRPSSGGAELLYALGKDGSKEGKRIAGLEPVEQVEALVELKHSLQAADKRAAPPPVKKHTTAPPPATNLGGKDTEPSDPVEAALLAGDVTSYFAKANARDLKAATGR